MKGLLYRHKSFRPLGTFTKIHRPDFISSAHEKRLFNYNTNELNRNFKEKN